MPVAPSQGIFLSYRREDAAPYARLLQYELRERFPNVRVFMDLDSIEPGLDFAEVIREAVDSCAVLLALIGRQWATLSDEQGHRRLDDPDDFVRFEVRAGLERGLRVIPVLVDGARPLRQEQLPAELHKLARLNSLELSYSRYEYDADRLLDLVKRVLAGGPGVAPELLPAVDGDAPVTHNANAVGRTGQKGREVDRKDQARITRVIIDAKRVADSMTEQRAKAGALADIAGALAATDPDRAEGIARSITYAPWQVTTLVAIARATSGD